MSDVRRITYIILGSFFVALGVIGMFVPVIPTTSPLLAAAFFYSRSSPRFYNWLMTNRVFGSYISNYRAGLGMPLRAKVTTLIILWLGIGVSMYLVSKMWVDVVLFLTAVGVTIHIVTIKTYRPPQKIVE